jgi:hypothetical protein
MPQGGCGHEGAALLLRDKVGGRGRRFPLARETLDNP